MIYPNIEQMERVFNEELLTGRSMDDPLIPDNEIYVFPQTWPNTGGGLAKPGYVYGQAFTTEYTTVIVNRSDSAAMVSFGNQPAYLVRPMTQRFLDDLNNKKMARWADRAVYDEEEQ